MFSPMFIKPLLDDKLSCHFHHKEHLKCPSLFITFNYLLFGITLHVLWYMEHSTLGVCSQGGTESSRGPFGTSAGFAGRKNTCVQEEGRKPNLPGTDHKRHNRKETGNSHMHSQSLIIRMSLIVDTPALMVILHTPLRSLLDI